MSLLIISLGYIKTIKCRFYFYFNKSEKSKKPNKPKDILFETGKNAKKRISCWPKEQYWHSFLLFAWPYDRYMEELNPIL